jgi:protocatechuate 3,4-dioxygenase beta subunit
LDIGYMKREAKRAKSANKPKRAYTIPIILLVLSFGVLAQAQQRDGGSNAATVSGRVTIGGKPASGVVVELFGQDGRERGQFAGETNAEGRFNIAGAKPGSYAIRVHAYVFVYGNQSPNARNVERIVVGAGETVDDISIELIRGGVVTGRVIDEDGRPVVGSRVSLQQPPGEPSKHTRSGSESHSDMGETDDRGVYRIFGVPPGRYLAVVGKSLDGNGSSYYVFHPNTTDQSKAKVIEVSAGAEKTEVNITVVPPDETYAMSGRLIDAANGKPVPGSYVECQSLNGDNGGVIRHSDEFRTTGSDGAFRLAGVRPGQYRLFILPTSEDGIEWYSEDLTVEVASEDVSGIELKAHRGASVSGVVTVEGANDPKLFGPGADAYVSIFSPKSEGRSGESANCKIGLNGGFRLTGLRPGEYQLRAWNVGNPRKQLAIQRVEVAGQSMSGAIELKEGQSISDARIVMVYGEGVVRGRLNFQNGEPQKNICFYVTTDRKGECADCQNRFHAQVSAGGQYMLEGLPPGDYELTLRSHLCGSGVHPGIAPVKQAIHVANGAEARADFIVDLSKRDQ